MQTQLETAHEAAFDIHELFFSITDRDSRILAGNEVFVRISGYAKSELIGRYHNVIRHPDMPKVLFKAFWDFLKAERPVVAYVKNRTKNGGYYWVLATVFILEGRYVSLRIKPTSQRRAVVEALYTQLSALEAEGADAEAALSLALAELGFGSYEAFMIDSLLQELRARQRLLGGGQSVKTGFVVESDLDMLLRDAYGCVSRLHEHYFQWFEAVEQFAQMQKVLEQKGVLLQELARDMIFLSLNASVASYRTQNGGETFGVLAHDIRGNVKQSDEIVTALHRLSTALLAHLGSMIFASSGINLQIDMVRYFIEELLTRRSQEVNDTGVNIKTLADLVAASARQIMQAHEQIQSSIRHALVLMDRLEQQVMYLGYVQIYGKIEAASDATAGFDEIFDQLKALIARTAGEIETLSASMRRFDTRNAYLLEQSHHAVSMLERFGNDVAEILSMERCE